MTTAELEQATDRIVWARLATDSAYRYAENAEAQAAREEEITSEVYSKLVFAESLRAAREGES